MRAEFEKHFPMPVGVKWIEPDTIPHQYAVADHSMPGVFDRCNRQNNLWDCWRAVRRVSADTVTIRRQLTPEAWKRLCSADIWPVTPKSFQLMLDVLAEEAKA